MASVTAGRAILVVAYRYTAPPAQQHHVWRRRFIVGAFAAGCGWGSAAIVLIPPSSETYAVLVAFVLGGMITGAVAVLSWVPGAFVAFLVPTALPIIVYFAFQHGTTSGPMAFLALVFVGAVLTASRQLHASVTESLALRFENSSLVHELLASESETASVNVELRAARDHLEARVAERTAELRSANAALEEEIAARKTAETAMQRERDLLEVTLASIGEAVIATDRGAILTFMNPIAEVLTGWHASDAVGTPVRDVFRVVDEQSRRAIESPIDRALGGRAVVGVTNSALLLSRDGREIPIAESGAAIVDRDGRLRGAVMVFRDITERRRVELQLLQAKEAAEAADRAKTEFLATMSHELRTPLNIVVGYADLMREGAFGEITGEQADVVNRISHNAQQLHELIAAILDLSRMDAGRLPTILAEVRVPELLSELEEELRDVQDRSGLRFVWKVEGELPPLRTDPGKLKVIVKNLVINATKFTLRGRVAITARHDGAAVEIAVSDTGIGIPQEGLAVIFEPFRQLQNPSRGQEGSGLGLHIVKRLLGLLGGSVSVESEVGRGSTFRVRIPLGPATALSA
jgi:PAS domain S-box-containing protein